MMKIDNNIENPKKTLLNFSTCFLHWEKNEHLYSAFDPVDAKLRWIIRPTLASSASEGKMEVGYVRDKYFTVIDVDPFGNPQYLGMKAVLFRLKQIVDFTFTSSYVLPETLVIKSKEFIQELIVCNYEQEQEQNPQDEEIANCHA